MRTQYGTPNANAPPPNQHRSMRGGAVPTDRVLYRRSETHF
jgi:hypothetical protein